MIEANAPLVSARRSSWCSASWLWVICAMALVGVASTSGCSVKVSTNGSGSSGTSSSEPVPAEVQEEIAGARVELSSVKEELSQVVQSGEKIAPEVLDAILARLEQAEAQLESMLERAEKMEQEGGDHDGHDHDGHDHDD